MAEVVQKKDTPFKNPKNKGGSPNGVKEPPILATKNIKKTTVCTLYLRFWFARIRGRINNIAAPVVPIQLASSVPIKIINTLTMGFPTRLPLSRTPPEIVNNANNRIINGTYSKRPTWRTSYKVTEKPICWAINKGISKEMDQNNETFPKFLCQKCGAISGKIAIDRRIPAKGMTQ